MAIPIHVVPLVPTDSFSPLITITTTKNGTSSESASLTVNSVVNPNLQSSFSSLSFGPLNASFSSGSWCNDFIRTARSESLKRFEPFYGSVSLGGSASLNSLFGERDSSSNEGGRAWRRVEASQHLGVLASMAVPAVAIAVPGGGKGGGLMDKPVIDKPTPGRESEFDVKRKKKISPPYRVLLHNDNFNRREYVVQVLMKVIPAMTVDQAVNIMQEAHINGMACVITCAQEEAEEFCQSLRTNGLVASIEPADSGS
eukprot:TRINITY_DN13725_c0_g2_i1.p1 TRINITY_DN13725_c0_g2~~TRINITY_DN13725_c0_g2_i1.p1  ORF type:complete len:256 (-),score=46.68 TRINITY_DN13725_c0_g2_i1:274-1041(-)